MNAIVHPSDRCAIVTASNERVVISGTFNVKYT